jgi:hypothetical protein
MGLAEELLEYLVISMTMSPIYSIVIQDSICKLIKTRYGLTEAPRLWDAYIDKFRHSLGYKQSASNPNPNILEIPEAGWSYLLLLLYVDDLLIAGQ